MCWTTVTRRRTKSWPRSLIDMDQDTHDVFDEVLDSLANAEDNWPRGFMMAEFKQLQSIMKAVGEELEKPIDDEEEK